MTTKPENALAKNVQHLIASVCQGYAVPADISRDLSVQAQDRD